MKIPCFARPACNFCTRDKPSIARQAGAITTRFEHRDQKQDSHRAEPPNRVQYSWPVAWTFWRCVGPGRWTMELATASCPGKTLRIIHPSAASSPWPAPHLSVHVHKLQTYQSDVLVDFMRHVRCRPRRGDAKHVSGIRQGSPACMPASGRQRIAGHARVFK